MHPAQVQVHLLPMRTRFPFDLVDDRDPNFRVFCIAEEARNRCTYKNFGRSRNTISSNTIFYHRSAIQSRSSLKPTLQT